MSVFDNKLPETCDTCDGPFHTEWIGQSECRPCGRGSDIPRANAAIDTLTFDTSSALENCRDYAEDALEILKMGRMSAQRKERLIDILEHIRRDSTDSIPDAGDYYI